MTTATGTSGRASSAGHRVQRCVGWDAAISREHFNQTPSGSLRQQVRPGRRSVSGNLQLAMDPDDAGAASLLSSILEQDSIPLLLELDTRRGALVSFDAITTSQGSTVTVGGVTTVRVAFQSTGPIQGVF